VLLADEVDDFFEPRAEPFTLLQLGDLAVPDRAGFVARYSRQELTYACTPFALGRLLDLGYRRAAFFKQESLVFGDLTPVFDAMRSSSIVLTPHLLAPLTADGFRATGGRVRNLRFSASCPSLTPPRAFRYASP
jgi:hypothetical protein